MESDNSGIIMNGSMFPIEFTVSNSQEKLIRKKTDSNISPKLEGSVANFLIKDFQLKNNIQVIPNYEKFFITVEPGACCTIELKDVIFNQNSLTVRSTIDGYVKYLQKEKVILSQNDICIRITPNLTCRTMKKYEKNIYIKENNKRITNTTVNGNSIIQEADQSYDQYQRKEQQIAQSLKKQFTNTQIYGLLIQSLKEAQKRYEYIILEENKDLHRRQQVQCLYPQEPKQVWMDSKSFESQFKNQNEINMRQQQFNQIFNQILQQKQKNKLGKQQSFQVQYMEILKQTQFFNYLKKYFNEKSKLDKDFAKTAIKTLQNKIIFHDKYVPCQLAMDNYIDIGQSNEQYCLFSNGEQKFKDNQIQSKLKEWLTPDDVIKGQINDSYLFSTMAALAKQHPQLIYSLFVILKNPSQIYGVRLFIEGKWQTVTLDMQFPVDSVGKFCGAQSNDKNIWPMLLEKAYAKANGSYDNINFGTDQQGIQVLTGAPSIYYETKNNQNLWKTIETQLKKGSILTASLIRDIKKTQPSQLQQLSRMGLIPNHSYSVLDFLLKKQVSDKQIPAFIRLRSPLGHQKIRYGIKKQFYNQQNKQSKKKYKDSSFLMSNQDFKKYFTYINVCQIQQKHSNSWLDLEYKNGEFKTINIKINQKGKYSFTLYLKGRRSFPKGQDNKRCSWIFLLKKQGQTLKPICCKCKFKDNNTLHSEDDLIEGSYIMLIKANWYHGKQEQYCLSSYGPRQVWMQSETFQESYLKYYIQSCPQYAKKENYVQLKQRNIFKKAKFYSDCGYGFIQIWNRQNQPFNVQIKFGLFQQYTSVLSPYKCPLEISVVPGTEVSCIFISVQQFFISAIAITEKK